MSINTKIQWCDSTGNIQAGCEGCELVKGQTKPKCYAKIMTDRYAGKKGWPEQFEKPKLFLERLPGILNWSNLKGKNRPEKPWLNGLPRVIFLNDMGDTFSKGMPENWLAEVLPQLAESKHLFMILTKWPARMAKFSEKFPFPVNVLPGTTVTGKKTAFRAYELEQVRGGGFKWLSIEPMWNKINFRYDHLPTTKLFIYGGESGTGNVTPCDATNLIEHIELNAYYRRQTFIKQLGSNAYYKGEKLKLKDFHGGNWDEWPTELRVREFPVNKYRSFWDYLSELNLIAHSHELVISKDAVDFITNNYLEERTAYEVFEILQKDKINFL